MTNTMIIAMVMPRIEIIKYCRILDNVENFLLFAIPYAPEIINVAAGPNSIRMAID